MNGPGDGGIVTTKREIAAQVEALLRRVELPRDAARRFPHEYSERPRQRGIQPASLTLAELMKRDIPVGWPDQRRAFGFL